MPAKYDLTVAYDMAMELIMWLIGGGHKLGKLC